MDYIAHQAPLSMGFLRQEYWDGLPFPPPGDLPDTGIKPESPASPALQADTLLLSHRGSPQTDHTHTLWWNDPDPGTHPPGGSTDATKRRVNECSYQLHSSQCQTEATQVSVEGINCSVSHRKRNKLLLHSALVTQSCLFLCDPMDCSPPGTSVHGTFQPRIPEWVAISFSRESSGPRDRT